MPVNYAPKYHDHFRYFEYCCVYKCLHCYCLFFVYYRANMPPQPNSCRKSKKKKRKKLEKEPFRTDKKANLAQSDKGSYFQDWSSEEEDVATVKEVGTSRRKIYPKDREQFDGTLLNEEDVYKCGIVGTDSEDSDEEDSSNALTSSLNIVDAELLRDALKESAICRECKVGELELLEEQGSKVGLASKWILKCKCVDCKGHKFPTIFHTSKKEGRYYDINRVAVMAFRSIGRGYSAAQKFCSIVDLPTTVTRKPWSQHTQAITKAASTLLEEELGNAAFEVKRVLMKIGDIDECTEEELKQKVVNTGATFDGSWSSRGWSARDGVVAAISVVTGKIVDVEYLTGSCSRCTEMEMKRINGSISRMQFLEWYIEHDENCYMNHNGSAPVILLILF